MTTAAGIDFAGIVDNLHDGVYVVDKDRRILYWNKAAERVTGFAAADVVGRRCADNVLIHVDDRGQPLCGDGCPLSATMEDLARREAGVYLHHRAGYRLPITVRVAPLLNGDGAVIGAVELFADNSPEQTLRTKVALAERLSLIDPLTQLPNRRYIESELAAHLALFQRSGVPFGVVVMDIDHFKRFNDDCGHDIGDLALQTVARTCSAVVRPFDLIGRWGGEEFLGIFPKADLSTVAVMAHRLCHMVRNSRVEWDGQFRAITVSVGATAAMPSDTVNSLFRRADGLMYASKRTGRDRVTSDLGTAPVDGAGAGNVPRSSLSDVCTRSSASSRRLSVRDSGSTVSLFGASAGL